MNVSFFLAQHDEGQRVASKHEALVQCWADIGPLSTTMAQPQPNNEPKSREAACQETRDV